MFNRCTEFNQDISKWDVSKVKNMSFMFAGCESFNQDISSWDISNVTDVRYMFHECTSFNQDLSSWTIDVDDIHNMFKDCPCPEEYRPKLKQ